MKVLIINSYAGSLTLGASALGADIIGSFEDCGYGIGLQKANFPNLRFVDHIKDWPQDEDLTNVICLAHPPCAAFSQQNNSPSKRGTETDAFECTRKVLQYALGHNCVAIGVESVMGALGGAWDVHDSFASRYGYHLYRVVKNSLLMGVPQYRERFWAVFVRRGAADEKMTWALNPKIKTIGETMPWCDRCDPPHMEGTLLISARGQTVWDKTVLRYVDRVVQDGGLTREQALSALGPDLQWKRTSYARVLQARHFPELRHQQVCKRMVCNFASAQPSFLAPGGYAPVLLGSSLWLYRGQVLTEEAYKAVMGFPPTYVVPDSYRTKLRTYLSKGVCPPVATWILDNIAGHLGIQHQQSHLTWCDRPGTFQKTIEPGHIASFRVGKVALQAYLKAKYEVKKLPTLTLRNEEEDLEA